MSERKIPPVGEIEGLLVILEHNRLELVERIIAGESCTDQDLHALALHGSAVASVRDAIAFRKEFDAM